MSQTKDQTLSLQDDFYLLLAYFLPGVRPLNCQPHLRYFFNDSDRSYIMLINGSFLDKDKDTQKNKKMADECNYKDFCKSKAIAKSYFMPV